LVQRMSEPEIDRLVGDVNFDKMGGLVPVVVQDASNDNVLMQAFMNEEALKLTLKSGKMHYWSRTRKRVWMKGEQSGNYSLVQKVALDCDSDSLLFSVQQIGPCCHTGNDTCFHKPRTQTSDVTDGRVLERIFEIVSERVSNPREESYVSKLVSQGERAILEKITKETSKFISAAKDGSAIEIVSQASHIFFHMMVLFASRRIDFRECFKELGKRPYVKAYSDQQRMI